MGEEERENELWIASSESWLDRSVCKWTAVCGAAHYNTDLNHIPRKDEGKLLEAPNGDAKLSAWNKEKTESQGVTNSEPDMHTIPQYVLDHAPLVHLHSQEQFWPSDLEDHLVHTTPHLNYTSLHTGEQNLTISDLAKLNKLDTGQFTYLQSNDDVEESPLWLRSDHNIPTPFVVRSYDNRTLTNILSPGLSSRFLRGREVQEGKSAAPAICIIVEKQDGVVDAFWFYFYSYNYGNKVLGMRFGNHVGDWEHSLVRFIDGEPQAVFLSAHSAGESYSYSAVEKMGKRVSSSFRTSLFMIFELTRYGQPVIYAAIGTHAMYASSGKHSHVLPLGLLHDNTDRGPLWNPLHNYHVYTYDCDTETIRPANRSRHLPTGWFYFNGHWGDKFYELSDARQYRIAGQYHYVNGPLGPRYKHLERQRVCPGNGECQILDGIHRAD